MSRTILEKITISSNQDSWYNITLFCFILRIGTHLCANGVAKQGYRKSHGHVPRTLACCFTLPRGLRLYFIYFISIPTPNPSSPLPLIIIVSAWAIQLKIIITSSYSSYLASLGDLKVHFEWSSPLPLKEIIGTQ